MKKYIILFLVFLCESAHAAFLDTGSGARPVSMGGASTAITDSIYSINSNPAGITRIGSTGFAFDYSRLYQGITDNSVIYNQNIFIAVPLKQNKIAAGLNYQQSGITDVYTEEITRFAVSCSLFNRLFYGITFKSFMQKYTLNDYLRTDTVFTGKNSCSVNDFDTGLIYYPDKYFSMGISIINLTGAEYGLATKTKLAQCIKTGIAYTEPEFKFLLDYNYNNKNNYFNFGIEKDLYNLLLIRTGFIFDTGKNSFRSLSIGIGLNFERYSLDYSAAFPINTIENTNGTYHLSFNLKFAKISEDMITNTENTQNIAVSTITQIPVIIQISSNTALVQISSPAVYSIVEPVVLNEPLIEPEIKKQESVKISVSTEPARHKQIKTYETKPVISEITGPKMYTVKYGDTLASIAEKYYNDKDLWYKIYEVNKDNIQKGTISPGQNLVIP